MPTISTLAILSIAVPWLGAVVIWLLRDREAWVQHALAVAFALAGAVAAVAMIPLRTESNVLDFPLGAAFGQVTFLPDGLAVFLAVVAAVIGSLAVIFSVDYMKGEKQLARYYAYVLFFIGSMVGLVLSSNLLVVFVFWEITALCSYALISFYNDDPKAVAAGIKALIITQVGGIGLLAGALFLFVYQGSYDVPTFLANAGKIPANVLALMAFGFLVAAAAKSAQFPFQTWLPDAMEAPTPISALIHAATMVNAGVYLLARFYPAFEAVPHWKLAVLTVGAVTALMAALMAVVSNDLKRVLAYSTVSQLGYMVYAIGAGGLFASQFHLLSHAVFKALLFLSAGAIIHAAGTRDMREMGGLGRQMPLVRIVMIVGGLALAGIPILNGFWSKELVLEAGHEGGPYWAWLIMVFGAGLTALYTLRFITMVFYGEPRGKAHVHDAGPAMKVALVPLALGTLTTWLIAGEFGAFLGKAVTGERPVESTAAVLTQVATAPLTMVALAVVALGLIAWWQHERLSGVATALGGIGTMARNSFGFEAINRGVIAATEGAAESLRGTQNGILNWNVMAILVGLVVVLAILALGGA
ncbi:MAG TPA: NADH-quinone oxidoreductase subunit L [Vicinamibacterales bacterium]|jgi:NADH-quinone oxidoreductase subunit L